MNRLWLPLVGIGASAGGLDALQRLFSALPPKPGMCFVVVSHLDPTHGSSLAEILGKSTSLDVLPAESGLPLEADRIYVLPPNAGLAVRNGVLQLTPRPADNQAWRPIDAFLLSAAKDQGERLVAVILSGAGADGSLGISAVKQHEGVVLVQDPQTAAYPSMPESAMRSGVVDRVLPPEQLAEVLSDYVPRFTEQEIRKGARTEPSHTAFLELLDLLRKHTKHDFTPYKPALLRRRIARRMRVRRIQVLADYLRLAQEQPEELAALDQDLLINVTGFFRDPAAWEALRQRVIAPLVRGAVAGEVLRAWVPACATGEEAYSVAMLLLEEIEAQGKQLEIRIFATDLSSQALDRARNGTYPASIDLQLSAERLTRFFVRDGETYRVNKMLRERLVFAPHDLLHDPAFSRLHLVSCRNFLIYLEPAAQQRLLKLFHFALGEAGYLFLGRSESIGRVEDLFQPVSRQWRIFRSAGAGGYPDDGRSTLTSDLLRAAPVPAAHRPSMAESLKERVQAALAAHYGPTSVVIDARYQVLYFHGNTTEFISQPPGAPTRDLRRLLRDGLSLELLGAVRRALHEGRPVTVSGGHLTFEDQDVPVTVTVCPLPAVNSAEAALLVSFEKQPPRRAELVTADAGTKSVDVLEAELAVTREEHRSTVEILEAANEELTAANEELLSNSEEFQATNEELQTSQEELQALNDELAHLNQELREKVGELETTTSDLENLLSSSGLATVFLDAGLSIRWFSPSSAQLLSLLPGDIGRPVQQLAHPLFGSGLLAEAGEVMGAEIVRENEIPAEAGLWYLRRIAPYRTKDGRVAGVLIVFINVTNQKNAELRMRAANRLAVAVQEAIPTGILLLDHELRILTANSPARQILVQSSESIDGKFAYDVLDGNRPSSELRTRLEEGLLRQGSVVDLELRHQRERGDTRILLVQGRRIEDPPLYLVRVEDVTDRRQAEAERGKLREAEQKSQALTLGIREAHHRIKNNLQAVSDLLALELASGEHPEAAPALESSLQRVRSIAIVHDLLSQENPEEVNVAQVIEKLLPLALSGGGVDPSRLEREVDVAPILLPSREASLLSLLLNELITNAAKHAFVDREQGKLTIRLSEIDGELLLTVQDDGPGLPAGFQEGGVGLQVVRALAEGSLLGTFTLVNDPGCRAEVRIPLRTRSLSRVRP